jgi:hypothetical protein
MTASERQDTQPVSNLSPEDAGRAAGHFLANLPWEGEHPDPETWRADEFLGLL